jgi:hypothetical protein
MNSLDLYFQLGESKPQKTDGSVVLKYHLKTYVTNSWNSRIVLRLILEFLMKVYEKNAPAGI